MTTNNEGNEDEGSAEDGLCFLSYDEIPMSDLLKKHRDGIQKCRQHKTQHPFKHETELVAFAQHLVEFSIEIQCSPFEKPGKEEERLCELEMGL